ncbi:16283_t:CDS:2, partial [Racocetra fulgida]
NLEHILDISDPTFSESDSEKIGEDICSKEIDESSDINELSDENTTNNESETAAYYNLVSWIKEHKSILSRPYKNIDQPSKNILFDETVNEAKLFIKLIGEQQTEGKITVNYKKNDIILLSSHYSYERLLAIYNSIYPKKLIKKEFQLLKKIADPYKFNAWNFQILPSKGLSDKKQVGLWEKICEYCPIEFQDELFMWLGG